MSKFLLCKAVALLLIGAQFAAAAQLSIVWEGGTGTWNTPGNWDLGVVPNNGSDTYLVFIDDLGTDSDVTLNISATIDGLTIAAGDVLNTNNGTTLSILAGALTNNGQLNLNAVGNLTNLTFNGDQTAGGNGEIVLGALSSNNRILTNNSVVTSGPNHTIRGQGQLLANTGGMVNNGTIIADGTMTINPNGLGFVNNGKLAVASASGLTLTDGTFTNNPGGVLAGSGTITVTGATLNQLGTISPGASAGMLTVSIGTLTMAASSDLKIQIGGLTVGDEYDRLAVTGNAVLDGDLLISVINGFTAPAGDSWTILTTTAALTGAFANAPNDLDTLVTPYGTFEVDYTANSVILTSVTDIIPEPASLVLLTAAFMLLARRTGRG